MKYQSFNQHGVKYNLIMQGGCDGDLNRGEYDIKVMNRQQHNTPKKAKRFRSAFTTDQLNYLENQFKRYPYIGSAQRKELASSLNISDRAIKIWFQNRRMKEKRESKELEDEQQSPELHSDQLKYIVPRTNEQPRSIPHIQITLNPEHGTNMVTNNSTRDEARQVVQVIETPAPVAKNLVTSSKVIHPPSMYNKTSYSSPDFKASAEFSIDLCKKYKSETFSKPPYVEQQTIKMEVADTKKMDEPKSVKVKEQKVPEDLSPSRVIRYPVKPPQTIRPGNVSSNPEFVPMVPAAAPFYTQPYISASGGMVWKQVNVIPAVTSSATPVFAPSKPPMTLPYLQESFTRSCNCDCHTKQLIPQIPNSFPQHSPTPQYIITFQNPSTK